MNIFRFDETLTSVGVYVDGVLQYVEMYKAFSPNILEIWQLFHQPYTANISLPTLAQLSFRYDAIFLANFKMSEVFFIKQLSTYWLPLELSFTSKKDGVKVKCLMIEKTPVDVPVVFDQSLKVSFYGDVFILDINALYSAQNVSPAASMTIVNADLTKNDIFINGVQVLAFPTNFDVSAAFELKVSNIEPSNELSNSNIIFRFTSEEGGVSRDATINVAHDGRADFVSEFRSAPGVEYTYENGDFGYFARHLNYASKITTPINIADTLTPAIGDVETEAEFLAAFKVLDFQKNCRVKIVLNIGSVLVVSSISTSFPMKVKLDFNVWKNGTPLVQLISTGVISTGGVKTEEYTNLTAERDFDVLAGDEFVIQTFFSKSVALGGNLGRVIMKDVNWQFKVSEQL